MKYVWKLERSTLGIVCALAIRASLASEIDSQKLDCVIEPKTTVELASPVPGVLDEIFVERGARVRKGQLLAKLKSGVEEANVKLARAQAELSSEINASQARLDLNARIHVRTSELYKTQMVALAEADEAETKKVVAEYEVKKAREDKEIAHLELARYEEMLKQRYLASSIDGVVVKRYKAPGDYVEDQPVLKIAQDDPLNVEVIAPLSLHRIIHVGMRAEVQPEQPIGGKYNSRVIVADSVIDAASGTFGVRLELPNSQHRVPAGVRCDIHFLTEEGHTLP